MVFDPAKCAIPSLWCGRGRVPADTYDTVYTRAGTSHECLKKGIGAGIHEERRRGLPRNSLQRIKYVGPVFEEQFQRKGINTIPELMRRMRRLSDTGKANLLDEVFTTRRGGVDQRGVNSVLLYLYDNGVDDLPDCQTVQRSD